MVEIVAQLPTHYGRSTYPWNEWLDGKPRAIHCAGHDNPDVPITRKSLRTYAYAAARDAGITVSCHTQPGEPHILYIQAHYPSTLPAT